MYRADIFFFEKKMYTCLFFDVSHVHAHEVSGSHAHVCPRPWSSTYRWNKLGTHQHRSPRSVRGPCSHAQFDRFATACVSSPRDWAVFISSHMQQNSVMPAASPQLGALFSCRTLDQTNGHNFAVDTVAHVSVLIPPISLF